MLSKKLKYILLVVPIFYLIVSIFLLDREYGYLKIENDILPLNLLIPVNENSYLNDNDLTLTPNISGQCIYNSKTVSEAFKLRGIDFNDISIKNSDNSFKTIFDLRCWGRYIGTNIPQFSNLDSFQETSLEIYYVTTPNPLIFVILLYLFYLLIKNIETISRPIYFVLKKYLQNQNFYFWCLAFFILVEFKYFINSKFVMSYSFLLLIFYCIFSLIFFRKFKLDNKDKYLYPVFIFIGLFYLIFEAKIDLFNFYIESDYYISMRGLLAVQSTYEQSLLNHNYFMEEFGAGQRLVGQWGNNYLPRILIFKMISNSDLAYFIYICVHYLISFYILLLASNRYLNNKFTSLLAVSLFILSNITILWTQLTHMPPTLLSFSILLLSITYLRDKKFNIFYILSFIGFLILFQVSNIQFFVYVAGITAGLILIVFIEKKLHYSQIPKLFIGFFAAIPFGYKPIKLYFETLAFSARTSYEVNPEKYIMTSEHFKSLFRFDNYSNYFIEGNSDLYFSFLSLFIFFLFKKKYRSDYQIKFLFFVICFFVLVSTDFLISALINFNPIFSVVSNYQRVWSLGILFLILLVAKIVENESRSNFYRALIIGFLLTISTVTRVEYYLVDGPDNFYSSRWDISISEIKDQENELISILNKHNDQNYRWAGMCSKYGSASYFYYIPNKGLLAKNTRWFDLYDSWSTKRYFNYFTEYSPTNTEGGKRYHHREVASANLDFLAEANVKKIIATKPCDIFLQSDKVIKIDESNSFLIYELKKSKELVDFVDNPIQKPLNLQFTEIQQYISEYDLVQSNHDLDLNNFSSKDSFLKLESEKGKYLYEVEILNKNILILRISHDPRWKVYINGIEKNIIHVDYLFMGVELDSNSELVLFEFDDSIIK